MVIEECAKLIQSINKIKRTGAVSEKVIGSPDKNQIVKFALIYYGLCSEVADVKIMLKQLELLLNKEAIDLSEERKIARLKDRIEKFKNNKK